MLRSISDLYRLNSDQLSKSSTSRGVLGNTAVKIAESIRARRRVRLVDFLDACAPPGVSAGILSDVTAAGLLITV
jgi:hypothetical protein